MMQKARNIVIIGATSAIAGEVALHYASSGSRFFLAGRNEEGLAGLSTRLRTRGAQDIAVFVADLRQRDLHQEIVIKATEYLSSIDIVLIAHGVYPEQETASADVNLTLDSLITNAVSPISFMHRFALVLQQQRARNTTSGFVPRLVVISSVAGDRGRKTNYAYGSAKSAVTAFASGLGAALVRNGIRVITVKPGPVATPFTKHIQMPLLASVRTVADDIVHGIARGKSVIYTPWYWRWIMMVVRSLPQWIFRHIPW